MLTFEFTGVEGKMTVTETLTSGMVGKEISIITDRSWDGLSKFAVFRAGQVCKTVSMEDSAVTIPEEVLQRPFCKLYVGLYGTDAAQTLVIPTIMAEGPYIRYGADPMEDDTAEELPVWKNLQDQIGELENLDTLQKDNLVAAVNELAAKISAEPEEEEEDTGLSSAAAALLTAILRQALYYTDQSANITALEILLNTPGSDSGETEPDTGGDTGENEGGNSGSSGSDEGSDGGDSETVTYTVTYALTHVTTSNSNGTVSAGSGYSATLTAEDGYELQTVTVIMGGTDISASACSGNTISIGSVTGNLIITAAAAEISNETNDYLYHWDFTGGTLVDAVGSVEAITDENLTIDSAGAHFTSADCFLKMPVDSTALSGSIVEVKFGAMSGVTGAGALRLFMYTAGVENSATTGLFYSTKGCWTHATATQTEFTDVNMFANKTLVVKFTGTTAEFYYNDQLITTQTASNIGVLCLGGWTASYLGDSSYRTMVVESVKIYKTA